MGLFGFSKKNRVIDLSEHYKRQKEKEEQSTTHDNLEESSNQSSDGSGFAVFDTPQNETDLETTNTETGIDTSSHIEKRKRLANRILEMTNKVEELSNEIYHLQQRIEVLERKHGVNRLE